MQDSIPLSALIFFGIIGLIILSPLVIFALHRELKWLPQMGMILLALSLGALTIVAILFDHIRGGDFLHFCLGFILISLGIALPVILRFRSKFCICIAVFFLISIVILHFTDLTPVKPYKRFFASVQNGMTTTEVMAALHREFPDRGRFPVPVERSTDTNALMFFLDPSVSDFNAEGVFINLQNNRVVSKQYSPD